MTSESELKRRIYAASLACDVPIEGVVFIFIFNEIRKFTHLGYDIDGTEFSWHLHDKSLSLHGDDAKSVLANRNLNATYDFGRVVFALVDYGLVSKRESDSIADFENVFEFDLKFVRPRIKEHGFNAQQWTIYSLLLLTVVSAVAIAGFVKNGISGMYSNLLCGWLLFLGVCCTFFGIQEKAGMRIFLCGVGVILTILGGVFIFGEFAE